MISFSNEEWSLFAQIVIFNLQGKANVLSDAEKKQAAFILKSKADQRMDWTPEQRDLYKLLVEWVEENT